MPATPFKDGSAQQRHPNPPQCGFSARSLGTRAKPFRTSMRGWLMSNS